jgi:hypothetical protein
MINASGRPMMIENCHWYANMQAKQAYKQAWWYGCSVAFQWMTHGHVSICVPVHVNVVV